jgi:hypothetical protein
MRGAPLRGALRPCISAGRFAPAPHNTLAGRFAHIFFEGCFAPQLCFFAGRSAPAPHTTFAGRSAPAPPARGTEAGSPSTPPAKNVIPSQPDRVMPRALGNRKVTRNVLGHDTLAFPRDSILCRGSGGALRPGTLWVPGSARGGAHSHVSWGARGAGYPHQRVGSNLRLRGRPRKTRHTQWRPGPRQEQCYPTAQKGMPTSRKGMPQLREQCSNAAASTAAALVSFAARAE